MHTPSQKIGFSGAQPPSPALSGAAVTIVRPARSPAFSICSLVTNPAQYAAMRSSFERGDFDTNCEYLCIDNSSGNRLDAYAGITAMLAAAQGDIVILCHQDVTLLADGRAELEARLAELAHLDPDWAIAGNAGMTATGLPMTCLSDPHLAYNVYGGPLPAPVVSLDENFLVVRRAAGLAVSPGLSGFHLYGADLCQVAAQYGMRSYVVDFFLRHDGGGTLDSGYFECLNAMSRSYSGKFPARRLPLIVGTELYLGGTMLSRWWQKARRPFAKVMGLVPRNRDLWASGRLREVPRHRAALAEHFSPEPNSG